MLFEWMLCAHGGGLVSIISKVRILPAERGRSIFRLPRRQPANANSSEPIDLSRQAPESEDSMGMVTGILIRTGSGENAVEQLRKVLVDGSFGGIGEAIRSESVEPVYVKGCHFYRGMEAKLKGKPPNRMATRVAQALGWLKRGVVYGDVIFLDQDAEGDEASLPEELAQIIIQIALSQ